MTEALSEMQLALFMTKGVSLAHWDRIGQLDREIDYLNRLAQQLRRVFIFSYGSDADYQSRLEPNVTIVSKSGIGSNFLYQLTLPFIHRRLLRQCRILKTNQLYAAVPALIAKILQRESVLAVRCGYIASLNAALYRYPLLQRWYTDIIERLALRMADVIMIPTNENAEYLRRKYPFAAPRIAVLNNAINPNVFRPFPKPKTYDLGYVGRLDKDKNLLMLLEALAGTSYSVCFVGQGPEKTSLRSAADRLGVRLTFIDRAPNFELPEFYNSFGVFAFPSLHEGNPKTLLEAMACGRPVIACPVVGVENIISSGVNGLLVRPEKDAWHATIQTLVGDEKQQTRLGAEARTYIEQYYGIDSVVTEELRHYRNRL